MEGVRKERRRSRRLATSTELLVSSDDAWRPVELLDVSSHGARFRAAQDPRPGSQLRLALRVACHLLRLTGTVVRTERRRFAAVDFDPLTPEQEVVLETALLEIESAGHASQEGAVLLMIEEPALQAAIGNALCSWGYRLIARSTPLDAVQSVVDGPPLRAAIVSAGLPHGGGQAVLDYLADECPQVRRALLLEAHHDQLGLRCPYSSPPHHVLTSPYREHELAALFA